MRRKLGSDGVPTARVLLLSWVGVVKVTVTSTFDRELEVYNMLDLDADGEDVEVDVDDATGEIVS